VLAVLDQERLPKVHLTGISYGSLVAQHFAVNYQSRLQSLVLLSTFAHKTPYYEAVELSWWRALQVGGYNLMLDIMLPTVLSRGYFSNPVVSIKNLKEARQNINQSSQPILNLMEATRQRPDFRKELRKIVVPTLIVHGEQDMLLPVELANEVHLHIKGSKFVVIKRAGHTLNLESVPEVCGHVLSRLSKNSLLEMGVAGSVELLLKNCEEKAMMASCFVL
jgi:3-oxoadipate enol-lactonase